MVAVAFDEMLIKEGLTYNRTRDRIDGFSDGTTKNKELANHAIAFIVRAIVQKMEAANWLFSGPIHGSEMKKLLM